jgi:hypothetical protein
MAYAKFLVITGLVLLVVGLIQRQREKPVQGIRWKLLRDRPADLKDTIYHPKEWRKPRK